MPALRPLGAAHRCSVQVRDPTTEGHIVGAEYLDRYAKWPLGVAVKVLGSNSDKHSNYDENAAINKSK